MARQGYREGSIQDLHDYLENYYLWNKETGWFLNKDVKISYPDYNFSPKPIISPTLRIFIK